MKRESKFQSDVIKDLKRLFPQAIVLLPDPSRIQGIPDIVILHNDRWAALEVKKYESAPKRPNQDYYVDKMDDMSYAAFIYPENKEEILNEIQRAFES